MCSNRMSVRCLRVLKRLYHRCGMRHVTLYLCYTLYILLGASLFYILEHEYSSADRSQFNDQLAVGRRAFVLDDVMPELFNNSKFLMYLHDYKSDAIYDVLVRKLADYERSVHVRAPASVFVWTYAAAILYAWSTITTIGHGYIYPVTKIGRAVSIVYTCVGIPFTLIVLKDMTYVLAKILNLPGRVIGKCWNVFRYCTLNAVDERAIFVPIPDEDQADASDLASKHSHLLHYHYANESGAKCARRMSTHQGYKSKHTNSQHRARILHNMLNIPTIVAVFAMVGWLCAGALLVQHVQPHWDTFTALYFLFDAVTTVGTGDVQPSSALATLPMFMYIFGGIVVLLLFINLLYAKFTLAYWLPEQLAALSRWPAMNGQSQHCECCPQHQPMARVASFDDEDISLTDLDLASYISLGILQVEDRRPMIGLMTRDRMNRNVETQTGGSMPVSQARTATATSSEQHLSAMIMPTASARGPLANSARSHDDVNSLLTKQYHTADTQPMLPTGTGTSSAGTYWRSAKVEPTM